MKLILKKEAADTGAEIVKTNLFCSPSPKKNLSNHLPHLSKNEAHK